MHACLILGLAFLVGLAATIWRLGRNAPTCTCHRAECGGGCLFPRSSATGQPLTPRERYESECG